MAPQSNAGKRTRTREEPYMPSYLARGQKCVVCADLATGLHYRAITCEGCKGFFRRVYQRDPHFECKGQPKGQCPISKSTRNACQKCRQDKCLRAGMDPQLVLDEVQRKMKRGLIERNRSRRQVQKRLCRIRRAILPARGLGQEEENRIRKLANECAKTFVGLFEGTTTNLDGGERNKGGQYWALLWRLRVLKFAQAVLAPMELEAEESRNLDWRSLLVFVAAIRINPFGDENLGNEMGMGRQNGLGGNEIQVGKDDSPLQMDLAKMARKLAENELTNVQIGIMAAYLVFRGIQNAKITQFLRELLSALRLATAENLAKGETVEERMIPNWALLGLRLAELEELAKKHGAELEEGKLAEKLGENIQ